MACHVEVRFSFDLGLLVLKVDEMKHLARLQRLSKGHVEPSEKRIDRFHTAWERSAGASSFATPKWYKKSWEDRLWRF